MDPLEGGKKWLEGPSRPLRRLGPYVELTDDPGLVPGVVGRRGMVSAREHLLQRLEYRVRMRPRGDVLQGGRDPRWRDPGMDSRGGSRRGHTYRGERGYGDGPHLAYSPPDATCRWRHSYVFVQLSRVRIRHPEDGPPFGRPIHRADLRSSARDPGAVGSTAGSERCTVDRRLVPPAARIRVRPLPTWIQAGRARSAGLWLESHDSPQF